MEFQPYLMRVSISDLNIRKAPGTDKSKNGKVTGAAVRFPPLRLHMAGGVFFMMEEQKRKVSDLRRAGMGYTETAR